MTRVSQSSRLRDVLALPIGDDAVTKVLLQLNLPRGLVFNPIVGAIRLNLIKRLLPKNLGESFINSVIDLVNSCPERREAEIRSEPKWWKEAVFYQIYPRSFQDSDGDGIGDINGIISRLDYLQDLGVDAVWLCPVYDSPQDDNGYDIRDYYAIDRSFGSMEDFDSLLEGLHSRGMRLIMDLVVNHTSDEHAWFKSAISDENSPYRGYYHIVKCEAPPNNWTSFFSGSAWRGFDGDWALHLFSNKQMDLNWENENLRADIRDMIKWWLEKGVDGFRLDVINYISKKSGLPDGDTFIGGLMGFTGVEHYFFGPRLNEFLKEIKSGAFEPYDAFSVGETPGVGLETSKLLCGQNRGELDMIFTFDHLEMPGKSRFDEYQYDIEHLKRHIVRWTQGYDAGCRQALFTDNHDNPRMVSKIDPGGKNRDEIAKLLAVILLTSNGTPFIYQGQELAAVNRGFSGISDFRDIESLNYYAGLIATMPSGEALRKVAGGSRDNARIPMRWDSSEKGGFTDGEAWIAVTPPDGRDAGAQMADKGSVYSFYKRLIALRKEHRAMIYGETRFIDIKKGRFVYERRLDGDAVRVECNLTGKPAPRYRRTDGEWLELISSSNQRGAKMAPYEACVYLRRW